MFQEVTALKVVQDSEYFPKLIGIIAAPFVNSFVMEFMGDWNTHKSSTLSKQLDKTKKRISRKHWLLIIKDVGNGLKHLHGKGYIHCDLHSGNVLVCRRLPNETRPRAKIIDLGKAVPRTSATGLGNRSESGKQDVYKNCRQIAPEIVEAESFYTVQSDIYSYGHMVQNIAESRPIPALLPLAGECQHRNPSDRCTIGHVFRGIDAILNK